MTSNHPLRIAHVTPVYLPYHNGVSTVVAGNVRQALARGHQVAVFTARRNEPDAVERDAWGATIYRLPAPFRIGNAPWVPSLLRLGRFDLIHLHYPWYFGAEFLWLRLLASRMPLVTTYHHDVVFSTRPLRLLDWVHRRTIGPQILRRSAFVITGTMDYARHSTLWRQMGAQTGKIVEMGFGVDSARFSPGTPDPSLARLAKGDGLLLLFVAALDRAHYHKGLGALLEALAPPDGVQARLLVVGDGEDRPMLEARARSLGLDDRVHFLGRQSQDGLIAALRTCDGLILPSETQSEAFGMVVLEAMSCGKPTIVADLPGVRSLPPLDGVPLTIRPPLTRPQLRQCLDALASEQIRRRLGEAARVRVLQQYEHAVVGQKLDALYQAAASGRPRGD